MTARCQPGLPGLSAAPHVGQEHPPGAGQSPDQRAMEESLVLIFTRRSSAEEREDAPGGRRSQD